VNEHRTGLPPFVSEPRHEEHDVAELFGWTGGGIVLFGERDGERWIVARAWRKGDALTDVRRWSFAAPALFVRQVRRLVLEATNDATAAKAVGSDAERWVNARA
jgi:hypothetical protein